jgi:hypothetical protein
MSEHSVDVRASEMDGLGPTESGLCSPEMGGFMTRRALLLGALAAFSAVLAVARPEKSGPLEVTYYYLPG